MTSKSGLATILFFIAHLFVFQSVFAQSAKDYFKIAQNDFKEGNFEDAIKRYTKSLELEPNNEKAYSGRAEAHEQFAQYSYAAEDWMAAASVNSRKAEYYANAGRNYFEAEMYSHAEKALNKANEINSKDLDVLQLQTRLYLKLGDFYKAHLSATAAISQKRSLINTYWLGVVSDSLGNYDEAIASFEEILRGNHLYEDAYEGLVSARLSRYEKHTSAFLQSEELDLALENARVGLELFPSNGQLRVLRSRIYFLRFEFSKAIDDISRAIALEPDREDYHMWRGEYFQKFGQQQNAIADFSRVIGLNPMRPEAYFQRGIAHEATFNHNLALNDFEEALNLLLGKTNQEKADKYKQARNRILEMGRETDLPVIVLHHPEVGADHVIKVRNDVDSLTINGMIVDESRIKYIRINDKNIIFQQRAINPEFSIDLPMQGMNKISVTASDWYDNIASVAYDILRTEVDPPKVVISEPYASDDNELVIDEDITLLEVKGRVEDESHIRSITINGVNASYASGSLNPAFTAYVDISNKDNLLISVSDVFGNEQVVKYRLKRQALALAGLNPMGKTWVVFIENSRYQSLASIDGPEKDVVKMQQALGGYTIDRVIHKKNMTKSEMERFFSIELRDLVKSNRVNSLLVWYSGHGKQLNETGYWFPVDARRDDEFSYFNINALKAGMQSYSRELSHTLVVTDACDAGPSFADVTRNDLEIKRCEDWEATQLRSSQVLSASGYELASGNSPLSSNFVDLLQQSQDDCIPVEALVLKMREQNTGVGAVPKLGIISGFGHENGTFFFVRSE